VDAERLSKLADVIEEHPDQFDMRRWWTGLVCDWEQTHAQDFAALAAADMCGTTACIAGWAVHLWPADVEPDDTFTTAGARILGIDPDEAYRLFQPLDMTHAGAVATLRQLAAEAAP